MMTKNWNPETKQGRKRLQALEKALKKIKYREDLSGEVKKQKILKTQSHASILKKLEQEARRFPATRLGKLWNSIPKRPNLLNRLYPEAADQKKVADFLKEHNPNKAREKFPELEFLTKSQRHDLRSCLGIKAPNLGPAGYLDKIPPERIEELKKDWMDLEKFPEQKNLLEKYTEIKSKDSLRKLARKLDLPSRAELKKNAQKKQKERKVEPPKFESRKFPDPPIIEISPELWEKTQKIGKCVGGFSRIEWGSDGARAAIVEKIFDFFTGRIYPYLPCVYNVLNGGLVDKKYAEGKIRNALEDLDLKGLTPDEKKSCKEDIKEQVLQEIAREINSILPIIKKPPALDKSDQAEYVRLYIMPSRILDGVYGKNIVQHLRIMRPDGVRLYKEGGDRTRIKEVGLTEDEKRKGQEIGWLNPKKHRLPGQYASTAIDKEIQEEEAAAESLPDIWGVAGYGSSISKPGGGEKRRPRFSLPIAHIPMPRQEGEPSLALNQIGARIIETSLDGQKRRIYTLNLRDLARKERSFITGIKEGSNELHKKIVEVIKSDRKGFHVGELSDNLGIPREEIEKAIDFLVESKALKRTTWPGLYRDVKSGRYNLHLDWLQERLRYPWPYEKNFHTLRQLSFGCLHAGYNTTDYKFARHELPKIILENDVQVVKLVGDLVAGLKHHLIHRGQIIGNLNYVDQEIFAAELLGTGFCEVGINRLEKKISARDASAPIGQEELEKLITESLVTFLYIIGNHDAWQEELGITPAVVFRDKLIGLLNYHLGKFLAAKGLFTPHLEEILRRKNIELSEFDAVYEFEGGIQNELLHPGMSRTKTTSIRAEEALEFSRCPVVDLANFHTTILVEKWDPEYGPKESVELGQRLAIQSGAMVLFSYFEHGKLKRLDFGPTFTEILHKDGKIFLSSHEFFNKPLLEKPLDKDTNIKTLKADLKLLSSPI